MSRRMRVFQVSLTNGLERIFVYLDVNGGAIRDDEIVTRIKALAIPPAWAKVWICPVVWLRHRELIPR
jgi:hypothetical protein